MRGGKFGDESTGEDFGIELAGVLLKISLDLCDQSSNRATQALVLCSWSFPLALASGSVPLPSVPGHLAWVLVHGLHGSWLHGIAKSYQRRR